MTFQSFQLCPFLVVLNYNIGDIDLLIGRGVARYSLKDISHPTLICYSWVFLDLKKCFLNYINLKKNCNVFENFRTIAMKIYVLFWENMWPITQISDKFQNLHNYLRNYLPRGVLLQKREPVMIPEPWVPSAEDENSNSAPLERSGPSIASNGCDLPTSQGSEGVG